MTPVSVRGKTSEMGEPKGWDESKDGPCAVLDVRVESKGIRNYHYSNWKPLPEELAMLNAGGSVELCCVGVQPPVSVGVVPKVK